MDRATNVYSILLAPATVAVAKRRKLKPVRQEDANKLAAWEAENEAGPAMPEIKLKDTNLLTGDL
jgi:hypothetical protein